MWNDRLVTAAPERSCAVALALGCAGMVATSWPLWSVRTAPPPVAPMVAMGLVPLVLLVVGAGAAVVWPRPGASVMVVGLLAGVASDRLRVQPEAVWLGAVALAVIVDRIWLAVVATAGTVALAALWAAASTFAGNRDIRSGLMP
jgi:hypothetical protein